MKHNKLFTVQSLIFVLSVILILSACSGSPEKRAGKWQATSEFGDFMFVIDETGSTITHIEYDLECENGSMTNSHDMSGGPGSDLKDGKIGLKFSMMGIPMVEWEGKFNVGGTKASGTLWMFGRENCETKWSAQKLD